MNELSSESVRAARAHDSVQPRGPASAPLPLYSRLPSNGWNSVEVTSEVDVGAFLELLTTLRSETIDHSWRTLLRTDGPLRPADVEALLDQEQQRRPTTFLWFWGVRDGRRADLFAVATVAERVRAGSGVDGFPVLARSYILPSFRSQGLYQHLFEHRVAECRTRWGDELRGIHFGTSDARVLRAAERWMPDAPTFVGEEVIGMPEGPRRVRDYVALTPAYRRQLETELAALASAAPDAGRRLGVPGHRLLAGGFAPATAPGPTDYGALRAALDEAHGSNVGVDLSSWRALVAFCDAIPVLR